MQRVFLDTNVVIDFLGEREPFYVHIAKVLTLADKKKIKVYLSPISLTTVHYLLSKYESNRVAMEKIKKLKVLVEVAAVNETVVEKSIHSDFKDFEDAMQYYCAIEAKCEIVLTRNEKDYKSALIPVMSPESYLQTIL